MGRSIVVRGRLADPQHIELDEPITELSGVVEVIVRSSAASPQMVRQDVFELIAALPQGTRSKQEIDAQVSIERDAWGDR